MHAQGALDALDAQLRYVDDDPMKHRLDASTDALRTPCTSIPNPDEHPTITVPAAAVIAGVARRTGYAAAERGEWPVIRTGRAVRVRTREFLALCGFEVEAS